MSTPLMRQYRAIKEQYPDALLLFRMGDFFETFEEDAKIAAKVLGITLTKRSNGQAADVPLAGFPHHALDAYLPKLVRAGYRVAVCEQMEDPKLAKGIVKREVIEVVTPGVVFTDKLLDQKNNNFLAALCFGQERNGCAFVDASTGDFFASEMTACDLREHLLTMQPREVLLAKKDAEAYKALFGAHPPQTVVTKLDDWLFTRDAGYEIVTAHFRTQTLKGFGVEEFTAGIVAAGAALHYLKETQKANLPHLRTLRKYVAEDYIPLDAATRRNLEIVAPLSEGGREGTLISILDRTATAMGGRLFKYWLTHPLKSVDPIRERLRSVKDLVEFHEQRDALHGILLDVVDYERLLSRICTGRATPRELVALKDSLRKMPFLRETLSFSAAPLLKRIEAALEPEQEVIRIIEESLNENPPASLAEGGVIAYGCHPELDEIRDIATHGQDWIAKYQQELRQQTGIGSLKVDYNRVFGYYIEVSRANLDKAPASFIRKQTMVNAERFITPELKSHEEKVLNARERMIALEAELFNEVRLRVADRAERIQSLARAVAELDCLVSFAQCAVEYRYAMPEVDEGSAIDIAQGRHPVVERLLPPGDKFIPNDLRLDEANQILIITGPNMSGKSTFLRQTGLIVLLAHAGSFVPAASARIGVVDRIFTRVGASDNIAAGESTFLIEMQEAANILNNATPRSLILLDEIGRGTSTFDGISIAWAMTEYLHEAEHLRAKTLFATHYHELNEMADIFPRIRNHKVEVREYHDKVIFLRKVSPGTADHSYGIQVGQMAGLPQEVTARAKTILRTLEGQDLSVLSSGSPSAGRSSAPRRGAPMQINLFEPADAEIAGRLRGIDVNALTPLEALAILDQLKRLVKD